MEERSKGQGGLITLKKADLSYTQSSKQLEDFSYGLEIRPPLEPERLLELVEQSDILSPLIETVACNLALFGWGIKYKDNIDYAKAKDEVKQAADKEWVKLEEIFTYFNLTETFERLIYRSMVDRYSIGYGTMEIIRDGVGSICGGEYAQAANFRIAVSEAHEQYAEIVYVKSVSGVEKEIIYRKKFKKFVQLVQGERRYFKEFGDPRKMDYKTGKYNDAVPPEMQATEILLFTGHNPSSPYGNTPWVGGIADVLGNRKASEVNLDFFLNGKMIPFAILTNGGLLTEDSIDALRDGKGLDNFFKCLILEAKPPKDIVAFKDDSVKPMVDVKIQPLIDTSLKDGLFQEYQKNAREKIRAMFRLPPIYLGDSTDYTRATADTAKLIAEEQVFKPERKNLAAVFNMVLEHELNLKYCELYFKGPKLGNTIEIATALAPFIVAGTVTPNMLIDTLGELLSKDIEVVLPDELGNVPIEILKLQMQQAALMNPATEPKDQANQTNEEDIQKMAAVYTFGEMLSILKNYLGDTDAY